MVFKPDKNDKKSKTEKYKYFIVTAIICVLFVVIIAVFLIIKKNFEQIPGKQSKNKDLRSSDSKSSSSFKSNTNLKQLQSNTTKLNPSPRSHQKKTIFNTHLSYLYSQKNNDNKNNSCSIYHNTQIFTISFPNTVSYPRSIKSTTNLNETKNFRCKERCVGIQEFENAKHIECDSDSTSQSHLISINEKLEFKSHDKAESMVIFDLEEFIRDWQTNYNKKIESGAKIDYTVNDFGVDELIEKMISIKDVDEQPISFEKIKITKNNYDVVLEKIVHVNNKILSYILQKLSNKKSKKKCVKTYVFGYDFNAEGKFQSKGIVVKNEKKHIFFAAIGKKLFEEEVVKDLGKDLYKFKKIYSDVIFVTDIGANLIVKKGMLKHWSTVFTNTCLKKILKCCKFTKFKNSTFFQPTTYSFDKALTENQQHELYITFPIINLSFNDILSLIFQRDFITLSEIVFSQGFKIQTKICENANNLKTIENLEKRIHESGVEFPSSFFDFIDGCFMDNPLKFSNFSDFLLCDLVTLLKTYNSVIELDPVVGKPLYDLTHYPPAEKLKRAWKRFKDRLGEDLKEYCLYKEKERFLNCKYFLLEIIDVNPDDVFTEIAWRHEEN
ncbi:hypothetical protein EDEG_03916 [Edhazardia aedis USNM 41457]|uniref:Uncharacterized protein n=1 Tax=Edhazardia aedis (strain USNM 41457) TaxID=1003232 RepID=J9D0X0_EDHAE|nr:hypothetical protein EDEG_03916 [Edhazardia aedis USNM 41457]|eukprot:EJW01511.1 hypothetical protein EDEG_03916 [Edhazardia aedis USNM 41457]